MTKVIIEKSTTFGAGTRLELSKLQASVRAHLLLNVGDGVYETTGLVQFKAGEGIGFPDEISKAVAAELSIPIVKPKARSKKRVVDEAE